MPQKESKNAVNVINGMFKGMIGQMMKTIDNSKRKQNMIR